MEISKVLFYTASIFYLFSFLLFIRFFIWKRYANKNFWSKKENISIEYLQYVAKHKNLSLPFISILIPAKNEAQVIESTLKNMIKLNYPSSRFEVIVITDEREEKSRKEILKSILEELISYRNGVLKELSKKTKTVLSLLNLEYGENGEFYYKVFTKLSEYSTEDRKEEILRYIQKSAQDILRRSFYSKRSYYLEGIFVLRSFFPYLSKRKISQLSLIYASYLESLEELDISNLNELSLELLNSILPGTKSISERFATEFTEYNVKICEVPVNFSGKFPGGFLNREVNSTKGRALNFGLRFLSRDSNIVGFYDAESRPSEEVLLYVAERYLSDGEKMNILQGPLFQVRNFYNMGLISRLGGLFKAVSHDWYLPIIFKTLPFVGGTNLFVLKSTIEKVSGFDPNSLTEDLEFGVRSYLTCGKRVEFLPVISTEQTPPLFKGYFNQRLRWAYGHLEVMSKLKKTSRLYFELLVKGPLEWILYQLSGLLVVIMNVIFILSRLNIISPPSASNNSYFNFALLALNIPYLLFSIYCYNRYEFSFDKNFKPLNELPGFEITKLVISSLLVFLLPLPYTWATVLKVSGRKLRGWVKTERTTE
jgi:cellulose synthase/poly-beta-1,6-N-acetylglucosamine synthase-like glycosyltransferase